MNKKAIITLSGGLDSLVTLAVAINLEYELYALHINYMQNTQKKELEAYNNICDYYKIKNDRRLVVDISYLAKIGGTALINNKEQTEEVIQLDRTIPTTYVPFRNGNILAIAASWAEVTNSEAIFIGTSEVDFSGYPDCRNVFLTAFENAINAGTTGATKIQILAPLTYMKKSDIVKLGTQLEAPLELSWSCYFEEEEACGECESCILRLNGFENTGIPDPIKYKFKTQVI